jgi:hypothetical protein
MAWRPSKYLKECVLNNSKPGEVKGWFECMGVNKRFELHLDGDFDEEIRGSTLRMRHCAGPGGVVPLFVRGMATYLTGIVGSVRLIPLETKGGHRLYVELYLDQIGRTVMEFEGGEF